MVNNENDKWSDNGDLPINPAPEELEELSKKKILNNQKNNQSMSKDIQIMDQTFKHDQIFKDDQTTFQDRTMSQVDRTMPQVDRTNERLLIKDRSINESGKQIKNINQDLPYYKEYAKEPIKDLSKENQELKNKLSKLKEESKETRYLKDFGMYFKILDSAIGQLTTELKTFTDAKSWEALSRGNLDIRRYANYYDIHGTITTAGASDPNDFDSPVYNVERIFESLERYSEIIYVTNDGTDLLHVIVSHGGRTRFSTESPIYPKEIKCFFNIYEIRLRSPTAGLPYRVTEYCLHELSEISSIPIEKANLHNQALPAANTNWLVTDIIPSNSPTTFVIEVAVSIAGNFRATVTKGGNTQIVTFNVIPGPALIAGGVYIFNLLVHSGDSINFTYSVTGGTIQIFRVQEVDNAST